VRTSIESRDDDWSQFVSISSDVDARLDTMWRDTMTPCPCCHGTELVVASDGSIDAFYVANSSMPLRFTMIVCRACGDTRMRCEDPAALLEETNVFNRKPFKTVTVPAPKAPFR
jgi:hypothetical protein